MTRARNWFLIVAIATIGLACASDGGSTGTGGSGGKGGASGLGGSGGTGAGGIHEGAGAIGTGGPSGGSGGGGGSGGAVGEGGHAGSTGGGGGHAGSAGAGAGGFHEGAGASGRAGAGGHSGSGGAGGAGSGGQAGGGGAGGAKVCGGITGATCDVALGEFCYFANGQCGAGDQQGTCELAGGALCPQKVVCGCDGNTYSSACMAYANGTDAMSTTSCIPGNGGMNAPCGQDADCMTGYKCCTTGGKAGSPIACRQVTGACPALP